MDAQGEAKTPRVPAMALFRVGAVSPKRTRNSNAKPSVEKRKLKFKRGINARENRRRRSRASQDQGKDKKKRVIEHRRSSMKENATANSNQPRSERIYAGTAKEKLTAFYTDHNPSKLKDVDTTMANYAGKETTLFMKLANRYKVNPAVFGVCASSTAPSNTVFERKRFGGGGGEKKYSVSAKEKLIAFYKDHNPSRLEDVDKTLAKYAGKEGQLFAKLADRYDVNSAVFGVGAPSTTPFANSTAGAFKAYASSTNTFGSLTPPRAQSGGFGSFNPSGANNKGRGRSTINSLNTYITGELRASSDSDGGMECD